MSTINDRARDAIRRQDYDGYLTLLEDMTDPNNEMLYEEYQKTCIHNSLDHGFLKHSNLTKADIIKRIAKERVSVSEFDMDKNAIIELVDNVLFFKSKSIAAWMTGDRLSGFGEDAINKNTWAATVDMDEHVGFGYNLDFHQVETNEIRVILERTLPDMDGPGFIVRTMFPCIEHCKTARKTGKVLDINYLREEDDKKDLSAVFLTYLRLKNTERKDERFEYSPIKHGNDDYARYYYYLSNDVHLRTSFDCTGISSLVIYDRSKGSFKISMEELARISKEGYKRVVGMAEVLHQNMEKEREMMCRDNRTNVKEISIEEAIRTFMHNNNINHKGTENNNPNKKTR